MKTELINLLDKFTSWISIPPLLLSNEDLLSSIKYLKNVEIISIDDIEKEFIEDFKVYRSEDRTIKKELAKEIIEKSYIKSSSDYNIFVILEIDKFSRESGNMMLKTFEDIPPRTLFLFTSNSEEDILDTIRSRIIKFSTNKKISVLNEEIKEKIDNYFNWRKLDLLSFLYKSKLEREDYLKILIYLKEIIKEWKINNPETIGKILDWIENIYRFNVSPRNIVDKIFLLEL